MTLCKAECWTMHIRQTFDWKRNKVSADFWLSPALELGKLSSASGQLQVSDVLEVLQCVKPVTHQMLQTLLSGFNFITNPFIPVAVFKCVLKEKYGEEFFLQKCELIDGVK